MNPPATGGGSDIPRIGLYETCCWWLRRRRRFRVSGRSMLPWLREGEEVLAAPTRTPRVGDVVVALHPSQPGIHLIKRVASRDEAGGYVLLGDNPAESTDSRTLGAFEAARVVGPVTCRLPATVSDR